MKCTEEKQANTLKINKLWFDYKETFLKIVKNCLQSNWFHFDENFAKVENVKITCLSDFSEVFFRLVSPLPFRFFSPTECVSMWALRTNSLVNHLLHTLQCLGSFLSYLRLLELSGFLPLTLDLLSASAAVSLDFFSVLVFFDEVEGKGEAFRSFLGDLFRSFVRTSLKGEDSSSVLMSLVLKEI